jgi:hypothetical protein
LLDSVLEHLTIVNPIPPAVPLAVLAAGVFRS